MIENKELYKEALDKKGIDSQVTVAIEEMAEAIHVLSKYKRLGEGLCDKEKVLYNIFNELADCQVMIDQLIVSFDKEELFNKIKKEKLKRLEKRLNILGEKNEL